MHFLCISIVLNACSVHFHGFECMFSLSFFHVPGPSCQASCVRHLVPGIPIRRRLGPTTATQQWAGDNLAIPHLWYEHRISLGSRGIDWGPHGFAIVPPASSEERDHCGIGFCFWTHGPGPSVSDSWSFCSASCSAVLAHRQAPKCANSANRGGLPDQNTSLARHRDRQCFLFRLTVSDSWSRTCGLSMHVFFT